MASSSGNPPVLVLRQENIQTEHDTFAKVTDKPKKRQTVGSAWEKKKCDALASHSSGQNCNCTRLKCFTTTTADDRDNLIDYFNTLETKNLQDAYLSPMVSVQAVKDSRAAKVQNTAAENRNPHSNSYVYTVLVLRELTSTPVRVCLNAFLAIFGIKRGRVERLRRLRAATTG